ncbi:MAG: hypothetical protein PVI40_02035 [Chlamydiota bacterium]|jgi:hypothetical protein
MVNPVFENTRNVSFTPEDFSFLDESLKRWTLKKCSELPQGITPALKREIIQTNLLHKKSFDHIRSKEFILYRAAYKIHKTVENFIYRANDKLLDLWGDKRPIHERPLILHNALMVAWLGITIILGRHIYLDLSSR